MEMLKLSKFKLQLQSVITKARDLRERERSAAEQLHLSVQKQKQADEEYRRKVQELQAELASSNDSRQKLEMEARNLQNDNVFLENKHKELKGTIQVLLQSRESFLNVYQESICDMKQSIETRDRKIAMLTEKINSHFELFDSIEKEAFAIKQMANNVQSVVSQKEDIVAGLKNRMDQVSTFEKIFIERIQNLEVMRKSNEVELQKKDNIILELHMMLEESRVNNNCQTQIEEKTVAAKDIVIENLTSVKEALQSEVESLGLALQKIQATITSMNEEQDVEIIKDNSKRRASNVIQNAREYQNKASCLAPSQANILHSASPKCQDRGIMGNPPNFDPKPFESELGYSLPQPTCLGIQSMSAIVSVSTNDGKGQCSASGNRVDSGGSTSHGAAT